MLKRTQFILGIFLITSMLIGCQTPTPEPTATSTQTLYPTPSYTPLPISTFTPTATSTKTPTSSPTLSPTPSCHESQILKSIKADFPYNEFTVGYLILESTRALGIWFVDPDIKPSASEELELVDNLLYTIQHSALLIEDIYESYPCVDELFTAIDVVVVDSEYNGWSSVQVPVENIPDIPVTKDRDRFDLESFGKAAEIGYLRSRPADPVSSPPSGSCTWPEAKEKIQLHFSPDRENIYFQFTRDDVGSNVWAQWDSPTTDAALASILNIAMEISCLHPSPTYLIFNVVDENGEVILAGSLPNEGIMNLDLNQLQIA